MNSKWIRVTLVNMCSNEFVKLDVSDMNPDVEAKYFLLPTTTADLLFVSL